MVKPGGDLSPRAALLSEITGIALVQHRYMVRSVISRDEWELPGTSLGGRNAARLYVCADELDDGLHRRTRSEDAPHAMGVQEWYILFRNLFH